MNPYEQPEIVELGDASDLTLGCANYDQVDSCNCTRVPPDDGNI